MKLYTHPISTNAIKTLIVAELAGVEVEPIVVDLRAGAQRLPDFLRMNPNGKVPTLVDGDFALWESNAIAQYLAAKGTDRRLWPDDARAQADISRWQYWEASHWLPAIGQSMFERVMKPMFGRGEPDPKVLDDARVQFELLAGVLDGHLAGRGHLVGADLTIADISVAVPLMYTKGAGLDVSPYANIGRWWDHLRTLPAWQRHELRMPE